MLICLAGLRSIPDYIYEAAEVDRASNWRQFWSITLPMALPFIMLAILFRGIENFKMFDMVNLLTGGGPGSTTEVASITLKRQAFESWRTGYSSAFAIILFVAVFGLANIYVKVLNKVKKTMSAATAHSVVEPSPTSKRVAGSDRHRLRADSMVPLLWIFATSFKTPPDSIAYPPKILFQPSLEGYCNLFTTRTRQTPEYINSLRAGDGVLRRDDAQAQHGDRRSVQLPAALRQFADHRLRLDLLRRLPRHARGLWLLALQGAARRRPAVLHPVDAHDAADRRRDPDLPDVPRARPVRHRARHDPALHGGERVARGVAAQGLHRRDPARIRGSRDDRRLYAAAGVRARWCCRRRRPASPRPRSSA